MLEHNETLELIAKAQDGDKNAAAKLLECNMPLIKSIIKRYRNTSIEFDDLIQLGSWGLYKAIMNFNADFGVRFSTYAVPMIAGEIKRHIRDDGPIKVSRQIKTQALMINKFIEKFRADQNREPLVEEIAKEFDLTGYDVIFALDSTRMPISLFEKYDEDGLFLIDSIKTEDKTDDVIDKIMLREIISELDERDKKIIILRYYRDKTQSEVAKLMGVSQVQISRLENRILSEIKKKLV